MDESPGRPPAFGSDPTGSSVRQLALTLASTDHPRLRARLVELAQLMAAVVRKEGDRNPEVVLPLGAAFACLRTNVLAHLERADGGLLPALVACAEAGTPGPDDTARRALAQATRAVAAGQTVVRSALERLRIVTRGYAPPDDAGVPFRALYYGLAELERDVDADLRSERELLLPAARALARLTRGPSGDRPA